MDYLTTLTKLIKTSFKRSWQLLIILHAVKTKDTLQDWFNAEIVEKISERDKLFKKFRKSCLYVDKDDYKEARNEVQQLTCIEKEAYFESKLTESIGKP